MDLNFLLFTPFLILVFVFLWLWYKNDKKTIARLSIWFIFGVVLAFIIIIFISIFHYLSTGKVPELRELVGHGELFLICITINARAVGTLLSSRARLRDRRIWAVGASFILCILSSLLFVASSSVINLSLDTYRVAEVSAYIFAFTVVASGFCTILAKE